jgi:hypothetical protein
MDNSCLICFESNNLFGLHNRINADHIVCSECFDTWYIKKNFSSYNCILCKELFDINNLPNDIKEKIHSKPKQVHNTRLLYIRPRYFRLHNNITGKSFGRYRAKTSY